MVISAHYWPLALTATSAIQEQRGANAAVWLRPQDLSSGAAFFAGIASTNLRFGAWLTADSIVNYINTNLSTLVLARIRRKRRRGI